ncbi:MAG: hypothetical protein F6K11_01840 [Leptolyngbya sp. SIO3F4]|nr:hypothetical protein [Leptolyngbya sp. SIO3F4]
MKTLILKIILLSALCFPIDRAVGWIISEGARERQVDQRMDMLFRGKLDATVVLLGSSRALNDIDAGLLGAELGQPTYNLGYSGSSIDFHAAMLRLMEAAKLEPETLLLVMDERRSFIEAPERGHYRVDKLMPFIRYEPVLHEISEHSSKNYYASLASHTYRQNGNLFRALDYILEGQETRDVTNDVDAYGSAFLEGQSPTFNREYKAASPEYEQERESSRMIDAFRFLVHTCEEKEITLFIVFPPNHYEPSLPFRERVMELGGDYPNYLILSTAITETRYFFDHGHLNKPGVERFTKHLAQALQHPA